MWNSQTFQVFGYQNSRLEPCLQDQQHLLLCLQQSPPMDRNDRSSVQGNPASLASRNVRFRLLFAGQKETEGAENASNEGSPPGLLGEQPAWHQRAAVPKPPSAALLKAPNTQHPGCQDILTRHPQRDREGRKTPPLTI